MMIPLALPLTLPLALRLKPEVGVAEEVEIADEGAIMSLEGGEDEEDEESEEGEEGEEGAEGAEDGNCAEGAWDAKTVVDGTGVGD